MHSDEWRKAPDAQFEQTLLNCADFDRKAAQHEPFVLENRMILWGAGLGPKRAYALKQKTRDAGEEKHPRYPNKRVGGGADKKQFD